MLLRPKLVYSLQRIIVHDKNYFFLSRRFVMWRSTVVRWRFKAPDDSGTPPSGTRTQKKHVRVNNYIFILINYPTSVTVPYRNFQKYQYFLKWRFLPGVACNVELKKYTVTSTVTYHLTKYTTVTPIVTVITTTARLIIKLACTMTVLVTRHRNRHSIL